MLCIRLNYSSEHFEWKILIHWLKYSYVVEFSILKSQNKDGCNYQVVGGALLLFYNHLTHRGALFDLDINIG